MKNLNAKLSLALIALVGIGVFALPSTVALWAGQHSFYNIDAQGNQVPCQKCHGDVKAELSSNADSTTGTPGPHANFKCEYCHRIEAGAASGDDAFMVVRYHNNTDNSDRYLAMSLWDLESKNFPASINGSDVVNGRYLNTSGGAIIGMFEVRAQISPTTAGPNPLTIYRYSMTPLYSAGAPRDTNPVTQFTGMNLTNLSISTAGALTFTGVGSRVVNPGTEYHAASLVSCMECHGGEEPFGHYSRVVQGTACADCHYGGGGAQLGTRWTELAAGGFGLTTSNGDTGNVEAHNAWVKTPGVSRFGNNPENGLPGANNDACIACHTHVAIDINFQKGYKLVLDATESNTGVYSVSNSAVEGTVAISVYGNGSGQTFAVGDKTYSWTPDKTLYINGNGAQVQGLNADTSDSSTALTS